MILLPGLVVTYLKGFLIQTLEHPNHGSFTNYEKNRSKQVLGRKMKARRDWSLEILFERWMLDFSKNVGRVLSELPPSCFCVCGFFCSAVLLGEERM